MNNISTTQKVFTILLGAFLLYAGFGHLLWNKTEFLAQVPTWVPLEASLVVLLSGVVEIILGFGLVFLTRYRVEFGFATALFFVLIFPGNIAQYMEGRSAFGLDSDTSRAIRLLFQPLLVAWALWASGAWSVWREKRAN